MKKSIERETWKIKFTPRAPQSQGKKRCWPCARSFFFFFVVNRLKRSSKDGTSTYPLQGHSHSLVFRVLRLKTLAHLSKPATPKHFSSVCATPSITNPHPTSQLHPTRHQQVNWVLIQTIPFSTLQPIKPTPTSWLLCGNFLLVLWCTSSCNFILPFQPTTLLL